MQVKVVKFKCLSVKFECCEVLENEVVHKFSATEYCHFSCVLRGENKKFFTSSVVLLRFTLEPFFQCPASVDPQDTFMQRKAADMQSDFLLRCYDTSK